MLEFSAAAKVGFLAKPETPHVLYHCNDNTRLRSQGSDFFTIQRLHSHIKNQMQCYATAKQEWTNDHIISN